MELLSKYPTLHFQKAVSITGPSITVITSPTARQQSEHILRIQRPLCQRQASPTLVPALRRGAAVPVFPEFLSPPRGHLQQTDLIAAPLHRGNQATPDLDEFSFPPPVDHEAWQPCCSWPHWKEEVESSVPVT